MYRRCLCGERGIGRRRRMSSSRALLIYVAVAICLLALSRTTDASSHATTRIGGRVRQMRSEEDSTRPSVLNCTWGLFQQRVDHFGTSNRTFPQRYCMYDKWWGTAEMGGFRYARGDEKAPGPIFFYTGNESPVEEYINNTGLMWELAEQFGALIIFVEHRYEPLSHPEVCGEDARSCFAYCTTAQALKDWTVVLEWLRSKHDVRAPAVAFGGSYGGMLSGWFRMKYPDVIDGAIAASAPIFQLAGTVRRETLDGPAMAVTRGVSAAGGATDQCRDNLIAAWPLLREVGTSSRGLALLSERVKSCHPLQSADDLLKWAQDPYFYMAEGNYPFPSTYITYSLLPGDPTPLPAWPMRVACETGGLNKDLGIERSGSVRDVQYALRMGAVNVRVDWQSAEGNGANLTEREIEASGVLELAEAVAKAAGVWYNLTGEVSCYDIPSEGAEKNEHDNDETPRLASSDACPACPPCDDCPPCPVSYCDAKSSGTSCDFKGALPKTFSWDAICCNEQLSQIEIRGVGRDIYWPPQTSDRNYTLESVVGPHGVRPGQCASEFAAQGLYGGPQITDLWSEWLEAYYGGRNVSHHRNIVWSNGALDPWSGQGVYPEGGGPEGNLVQNISDDGSQIALVLDLGAHHLDLMFTDSRNPPCFFEARDVETRMMREWIQEAYDRDGAVGHTDAM